MRTVLQRSILVLASLVLIVAIAGLPVYVFPHDDDVEDADTAFVLGPPTWQRIGVAQDLMAAGDVSKALISVSPSGRQSAGQYPPCEYPGFVCQTPDPFTTDGEVAMLRGFLTPEAIDHQVVVITFTPHVARTRYIFDRCYSGDVAVIGVDQDLSLFDWIYQYAYQSAAFVKAALRPCS